MKLTFWGAARQVTGSLYLLEVQDEYRILIDCGTDMERNLDEEEPERAFFPFEPSSINLVLLTHAHIDHSGNIPNLYRDGYEGQVLCTSATLDLTKLLLVDAAHLHQKKLLRATGDSKKKKKKMERLNRRGDVYLEKQVDEAVENFVTIPFEKRFKIREGLDVTFYPAGHLLGAAHIVLRVTEGGETKTIGFSGDLGRKNYPLLVDPAPLPPVDYLICESTYGNRNHDSAETPEAALADVIKRTCIDIPGRLIIPAFSVGRTQALLYVLNRLYTLQGFEPIKVFSDSPLAFASTKVYERNVRLLNDEARRVYEETESLFDFANFKYIESEKASRAVSNYGEPCIIISSSGMIAGGRVEQHVAANLNNPYCTILLIGYAAEGTLGWRLMNGQNTLQIRDKEYQVLANVEKIDVFSGHGDLNDLLAFVGQQSRETLRQVFLVHGDASSMEAFRERLQTEGYPNVEIPTKGQTYEL
jgi:metallo-beta-lactamase family protein